MPEQAILAAAHSVISRAMGMGVPRGSDGASSAHGAYPGKMSGGAGNGAAPPAYANYPGYSSGYADASYSGYAGWWFW